MIRFVACLALLSAISPAGAAPAKKPLPKAAAKPAPVVTKPAPVPARLYDFKGIPLEISLEEFKAKPHPDGTPSQVVCTGDKVPNYAGKLEETYQTAVYGEVEKALGVKRCIYMATSTYTKSLTESSLGLAASGYGMMSYGFYFIPDPKDGVMRLYKFSGTSNRNAAGDVITAMTGKFGQPNIVTDKVQNKMGASFDHVVATWSNPASVIMVEDRYTKIDDMGIVMLNNRLSKIVSDADAAKKAATPNAI